MEEKEIGTVTHYYNRAGVAVIKLADSIHIGDLVKFKKGSGDVEQAVVSLQIDHQNIPSAQRGAEVAMKVSEHVKPGTRITRLA
ncbi:MAG: hypothetical protein A3G60_00920 [Candidatus Ryanbacteria bacterium RIFCSPLOWO2_12_FULL_47_9c]|uniref:Translation elongation factor-like protein n=2 Tax=Candidatus Ryaniibacteriota TaxID=1817914 RepID=A0A1G2H5F3_9BACT|nr:MAG: hypothetical protein A3J04_04395 [Candidatus Ryanbacteria bacterium RIFCSPLOWO2_02_FULL_47_14]OGZ57697.1 MAG: hypothetical protein A3G60_00920 [Candidatus Ryanbacteria bacterium RIFCSPLOWO2_12_FULL_47_9c]